MRIKFSLLFLLAIVGLGGHAVAQTSAISYRGRLTASGAPANGAHDLEFKLFTAADVGSGTQKGATITQAAVAVANGIFSVALDFGAGVFDGSPLFLEISVRPNGAPLPYSTLAPRQQIASIPYAIHSLFAGSATNLANGAAVLSLNNLKDNVTLAAGSNVTITPEGNVLTIASTSGGQSSPWSLNGADTYYSAGNVGIGASTVTPGMRLEVSGATLLKPGNGNIQFGSPSAELGMSMIPNAGNRADLRFDGSLLKLVATTGVAPPSSANGLAITTDGNVGIGGGAPTLGYRLDVSGATRLSPGNGTLQLGSPNGELGMSMTPNAGNRADLRFDGSVLKLVASTGVVPPSTANGLAITTGGRVGIGTTAPDSKLHVETTQPGTVVYGHALGTSGIGVYGHAPNPGGLGVLGSAGSGGIGVYAGNTAGGTAVHADGNATQKPDKGGFVKAMAVINPFLPASQYVVRCYNSQQSGNGASTVPCGITVTRGLPGHYAVDFGFNVENRFISVTPVGIGEAPVAWRIEETGGNRVGVTIYNPTDLVDRIDSIFHIIVF